MKRVRESVWEAVQNGDSKALKKILRYGGVDVNALNEDGFAVLHFAAEHRMAEITEILLSDGGADVNVQCYAGFWTPLMFACSAKNNKNGWKSCVPILLQYGADVNGWDPDNHMGALVLALRHHHQDAVLLLLKDPKLNQINLPNVDGQYPVDVMLNDPWWTKQLRKVRLPVVAKLCFLSDPKRLRPFRIHWA